jgi:hypothetical protein
MQQLPHGHVDLAFAARSRPTTRIRPGAANFLTKIPSGVAAPPLFRADTRRASDFQPK